MGLSLVLRFWDFDAVTRTQGGLVQGTGEVVVSTDSNRSWLRSVGLFLLDMLLRGLQGGLAGGLLALPIGLLFWFGITKWDERLGVAFAFTSMGAIFGLLWGVGQTFVAWFSDPEYVHADDELVQRVTPLYWGLKILLGPWGGAIGLVVLAACKDYSRGRPGRLKRGLVGAVVGACFGIGFVLLANLMTDRTLWQPGLMAIMAAVSAGACGLVGLASDSY
jgi:hypothetical protein